MPIENLNAVDIIGVRKNTGAVDLCIVTSKHLDSSERTQNLLLDKIENYLAYINSEEFKEEFGKLTPEDIVIILKCIDTPDPIIMKLYEKIVSWVKENGARIKIEIR